MAKPRQTLVTDPAYRRLAVCARFDPLGETPVKGFDERIAVRALRRE